jgi:toxin FitB
VSRYLLDTNIISNLVRPTPSPSLVGWMAERVDGELYIATLTLAEIERGIRQMPEGRRKKSLEIWFAGPEGPAALFSGRIIAFDTASASIWASLMAEGQRVGRPRSALDMIVAACAEAVGAIIVTDNERDFAGLDIFNPIRTS